MVNTTPRVAEYRALKPRNLIPGSGWRIWDRKQNRWWGIDFAAYPAPLLVELNGPKRTDWIVELSRGSYVPRQ